MGFLFCLLPYSEVKSKPKYRQVIELLLLLFRRGFIVFKSSKDIEKFVHLNSETSEELTKVQHRELYFTVSR